MSEYINRVVEDIFKGLNELDEFIEDLYAEDRDNQSLVLQMQALRHIRNTLNRNFPLPEVVPTPVMHEDKMKDVAPKEESKKAQENKPVAKDVY